MAHKEGVLVYEREYFAENGYGAFGHGAIPLLDLEVCQALKSA